MSWIYTIASWLRPTWDAISPFHLIPWTYRWRMMALQPLSLLTLACKVLPWVGSNVYRTIWIPTREGESVRTLVFAEKGDQKSLHVHLHAGAFIGGFPEIDIEFCENLARETESAVVALSYRLAPRCGFPAACEDVQDALDWLEVHARTELDADFESLTVSGFSAGGNLMYMAGNRARAAVGFYSPIDLRLPPWEKKKSGVWPKSDPMEWALPVFDAYARQAREDAKEDVRLNPVLRTIEQLPDNVLHVIAGVDVLVEEQLRFVQRLRTEFEAEGKGRLAEMVVFEDMFHGWCELPAFAKIGLEEKDNAFERAVSFIKQARQNKK